MREALEQAQATYETEPDEEICEDCELPFFSCRCDEGYLADAAYDKWMDEERW